MIALVEDMHREAARLDSLAAGFRLAGDHDLFCMTNNAAHAIYAAIVAVNSAEAAVAKAKG